MGCGLGEDLRFTKYDLRSRKYDMRITKYDLRSRKKYAIRGRENTRIWKQDDYSFIHKFPTFNENESSR